MAALPIVAKYAIGGANFLCRINAHSSSGGIFLDLAGARVEEQGLTDQRLHHCRFKGLGHQEHGLRFFAGQQPFWKRRYENHRNLEAIQNLVDCLKTRAAIGELDIGKHQAWPPLFDSRDSLPVRSSDPLHAMANIFDEALEVESNERFIFNDQDIRSQPRFPVFVA